MVDMAKSHKTRHMLEVDTSSQTHTRVPWQASTPRDQRSEVEVAPQPEDRSSSAAR